MTHPRRRPARAAALALPLLLGACVNDDTRLYEVELHGAVAVADAFASAGVLHVELHHARSGSGGLSYPLREIAELELDNIFEFRETVLVPMDEGEGLVVYAWLDTDRDGTLCAPDAPPEPVGLVELTDYPAHTIEFDLVLAEPCAGAESLYPYPR
ncbi:MAG: hypothetical protein R3A79_14730 [Nannocystaceae bacterium]